MCYLNKYAVFPSDTHTHRAKFIRFVCSVFAFNSLFRNCGKINSDPLTS